MEIRSLRCLVFMIASPFVLLCTSCPVEKPQAALFVYREDDLFMRSLIRGVKRKSRGLYPLSTYYAKNSQVIQNEQIENALKEGVPLMMINPVDRLGAYAIVKKLRTAHVPVIFFNREPLPRDMQLWEEVWYVGGRARQSGQMQAELAMDLFGPDPGHLNKYDRNGDGKIQTVILKGEQGHQDAEIRSAAVEQAFREKGYALDVLAVEVANWNRNEAYEGMDEVLDTLERLPELVLSNNDAMALGAIAVMRRRGVFKDTNGNGQIDKDDEDWVPVLGIDGVPDAVGHIQDGYLYATVLNDFEAMSAAITALAAALLNGGVGEDFPYPVTDERYIWIDYKTFVLD